MDDNKVVSIIKLRKVTIKGHNVETSFITSIEIYESITQPGITGSIEIQDYQALQEIGNVFADDEVVITFGVDGDSGNELNLLLKVYTNEGSRQLALNTYDCLRLGVCSPWLLDGLSRLVSKPYEDKFVHEIIEDLIKECVPDTAPNDFPTKSTIIGYIEPTKTKLENFVSPLWTPYHTIKHLLSYALNNNETKKCGGYLCWTDLRTGKVNVTTLDYMLKAKLGEYKDPGFEVNPANLRYSGRVKSMSIESSYDLIRMINTGIPTTKFYHFNYDTKEIYVSKNNMTDDNQKRLSKKYPLLKKFEDKKYHTHTYSSIFPETAFSIASDKTKLTDLIEGLESTKYAMLTTDLLKINLETLGETNRRVGWLAELNYPSVANDSGEGGDVTGHKQLKGMYLIREIKHVFSMYEDYKQYVTLVSDGFQQSDLDLIKWSESPNSKSAGKL